MDRLGTAALFARSVQGTRQWGNGPVQKFDNVKDENIGRPFTKRISAANSALTREKPLIAKVQQDLFEKFYGDISSLGKLLDLVNLFFSIRGD